MERAYTVKELDALRETCKTKWLYGRYVLWDRPGGWGSRCYKQEELDRGVEELVRTHMLAGHTAEDLIASEQPEEKK